VLPVHPTGAEAGSGVSGAAGGAPAGEQGGPSARLPELLPAAGGGVSSLAVNAAPTDAAAGAPAHVAPMAGGGGGAPLQAGGDPAAQGALGATPGAAAGGAPAPGAAGGTADHDRDLSALSPPSPFATAGGGGEGAAPRDAGAKKGGCCGCSVS
jgi:hypothetical protein